MHNLLVLLALLAFAVSQTTVINVSPSGSDRQGCGASTSPCQSLGFAVNSTTQAGTQILLASGIYNTSSDRNIRFNSATPSLSIIGAPNVKVDAQGKNRCLIFNATTATFSITGVQFNNCSAGSGQEWQPDDGTNDAPTGGALWISGCSGPITFDHVQITNARTLSKDVMALGGAAVILGSNVTFTNSLFDSNNASCGPAGAVAIAGQAFTYWENVTFSNNVADCVGNWYVFL